MLDNIIKDAMQLLIHNYLSVIENMDFSSIQVPGSSQSSQPQRQQRQTGYTPI